ncbi:MAG: U32 family peptidase [Magnetococcales bacterium]|nr:U32 family peptidase [Magnetococcales bacterium]
MMKISIGPVLFEWGRSALKDFYRRMAFETPADLLYLGEVVCSKRNRLTPEELTELAKELMPSGKEIVFSTLGLVMDDREQTEVQQLCDRAQALGIRLEANDMAGVGIGEGHALVAGPHVNVYNPDTLTFLQGIGVERMVFPVELPCDAMTGIIRAPREQSVEFEVFAHGRLPLTFSARCYTARAFRLSKANCQYKCGDFPDGMITRTQEGEGLLSMNGVQTMSERVCTLIQETTRLEEMGAHILRISPQSTHMPEIVAIWKARLEGRMAGPEALARLGELNQGEPFCNGYFHNKPGMHYVQPSNLTP